MRNLLHAGRLLLLDMASTLLLIAVYLMTYSVVLSVAFGVALGVAQIGWEIARRRPIDTMQWVSLVLVVGSGGATLITNDPRFMMLKLSVVYVMIGTVMLRRGWMDRYVPPIALEVVPDIVVLVGFAWSGLMFFSAVLNAVVALSVSVAAWASFMTVWGIASKLGLFLTAFATMRFIGARRRRAFTNAAAPPYGADTRLVSFQFND